MILEASPFLRTMMTAAGISKMIGIEKIKINYRFCEWLSPDFYEEIPLPKINVKNKDQVGISLNLHNLV